MSKFPPSLLGAVQYSSHPCQLFAHCESDAPLAQHLLRFAWETLNRRSNRALPTREAYAFGLRHRRTREPNFQRPARAIASISEMPAFPRPVHHHKGGSYDCNTQR